MKANICKKAGRSIGVPHSFLGKGGRVVCPCCSKVVGVKNVRLSKSLYGGRTDVCVATIESHDWRQS